MGIAIAIAGGNNEAIASTQQGNPMDCAPQHHRPHHHREHHHRHHDSFHHEDDHECGGNQNMGPLLGSIGGHQEGALTEGMESIGDMLSGNPIGGLKEGARGLGDLLTGKLF